MGAGGIIYSWQELSLFSCGPARRLYVINVQAELGITPNRHTSMLLRKVSLPLLAIAKEQNSKSDPESVLPISCRIQLSNVLVLDPDVPPGKRSCLPGMDLDMNLTTIEELGDFTEILIDTGERIEEEFLQRIFKGR